MTHTIDLTIQIKISGQNTIMETLDRFKKTQDIPFSDIVYQKVNDQLYDLTIRYPLSVFDGSATQFLAVLFGELPFMKGFGVPKFMRLDLPEAVFKWFGGPAFGAGGIRHRWGMKAYPFFMGIIKPSIDFSSSPQDHSNRINGPLKGGFHAVKDDEIVGDLPHLPLSKRMQLSQKYPGYIPVINADDVSRYRSLLEKWTPKMYMVNASVIGFPMLKTLAQMASAPILSHLALQGTYAPSFSPWLYAFLHRLFGCDAFITAIGDCGYYTASKKTEHEMIDALVSPLPVKRCLPLLAGGARLHNIEAISLPYRQKQLPYGLVFGSLFFYDDQSPEHVAAQVLEKMKKSSVPGS